MIHRAALLLGCAAAGLAGAGLTCAGQAAPPAPPAAPAPLRPFQTSYEVSWHGFTGGTASFELRQDSPGSWTYVNRNRPSGLFRLVPKASLTLTSRMSVEPAAVRPLLFTATTADGDETKAELHFDWGASRARGYFDEHSIDMALKAGVQDDLSVQVALINALANGQVPSGISLFDPNGIRDYDYSEVGTETLQTPAGEFATVIYRSHKQNSPRSTRFWCAPALGYIPVRAEQQYKGKVEWTMKLLTVHRD
jgi:Protein of unknown function (DUF3108)